MPTYADSLSLHDARRVYFDANAFGADGGYAKRWVKVKLGPVPIWFPNSAGRVRAVRYHDLHHVVTGYATSWTGEGEIGAWEIASGCRDMIAAWVLNLYAMWIGLWIAPRITSTVTGSTGAASRDTGSGAVAIGSHLGMASDGPSDRSV